MSSQHVDFDPSRRVWFAVASAAAGAGAVATCVPFVGSMAPSERAQALGAPMEVDIAALGPGQLLTVEWRGRPVWVLRRTDAMLAGLRAHDDVLADPQSRRSDQPPYARNEWRSIKPEIAVLVAICTHLGCVPTFVPQPGAANLGPHGPEASSAHAMDRSSTSRAGSTRMCQRRRTSRFRRIATSRNCVC